MALTIEAIDEQFIPLGTEDYDLVIDITGNPDTVEAAGHMEGFVQDWDAANSQLHIKAETVTRLIAGVFWTVKITKGTQVLTSNIAYNVVKPAAIFETLSMLHLYRDVPIHIDILIQNIPNLIVPNARLLGLKSELQEYGMNIKGELPADANFTVDTGDISFIVPSETGGTSEMHDYPYQVESGSPPAIVSPSWQPKGNFGALSFTDVNHALGYEWTLEAGDDPTWNLFNDTRAIINPSEVKITPGNLNVKLTFPNIPGASSYAYMLESESHDVDWTRFVGTLENNMITTIIPDLEEGVEYKLRLRVASPWIGTPITLKIYGGRIAAAIHVNGTDRTNNYLYLFHTGVPNNGVATRIKRILLPTTLTHPDSGGFALDGDFVYILNIIGTASGEKALYVLNHTDVADGARAAVTRKNVITNPWRLMRARGMDKYGDELYIYVDQSTPSSDFPTGLHAVSANIADGSPLTSTRHSTLAGAPDNDGVSVNAESFFGLRWFRNRLHLSGWERNSGLSATPRSLLRRTQITNNHLFHGISVIGDRLYGIVDDDNTLRRYSYIDIETGPLYEQDWQMGLPAGLSYPHWLDIQV